MPGATRLVASRGAWNGGRPHPHINVNNSTVAELWRRRSRSSSARASITTLTMSSLSCGHRVSRSVALSLDGTSMDSLGPLAGKSSITRLTPPTAQSDLDAYLKAPTCSQCLLDPPCVPTSRWPCGTGSLPSCPLASSLERPARRPAWTASTLLRNDASRPMHTRSRSLSHLANQTPSSSATCLLESTSVAPPSPPAPVASTRKCHIRSLHRQLV